MKKNLEKFIKWSLLLCAWLIVSPNANATTCANATPVTLPVAAGTALICGTANNITSANSAVCGSANYLGGNEAVYTFTPAFTGSITISYSGQSWSGIFLYSGCPTSGGTCVVNAVTSSGTTKSLTATVNAGTTYFLVFDTWPAPNSPCAGTFGITIPASCTGTPNAPTAAVTNANLCDGGTTTLSSSGGTTGTLGLTDQWQVSTVSGGPYVNVSGGSGATTGSYTTGILTTGTYYYVVKRTCSVTNTSSLSNQVTVNVLALPAAPNATHSAQCGPQVPTASVTTNPGGSGSGSFIWYDAATSGNMVQGYYSNTTSNWYSNDFSTTTAPPGTTQTLSGDANIASGVLNTQNTGSSTGGSILINANGNNATMFSGSFNANVIFPAGGMADGFSYSFGNDVIGVVTAPPVSNYDNAEWGSGTKLRLAFSTFGTGKGIYLYYGTPNAALGPQPSASAQIASNTSQNTSWIPGSAGNNIQSTFSWTIDTAGKFTLMRGATVIFNQVQLPAAFKTANKATWKHVLMSRSGGSAGGLQVDDLTLGQNQLLSPTNTYHSVVNTTTTFYVAEVNAGGCMGNRVPVTVTVNPTPTVALGNDTSFCAGPSLILNAQNPGATYLWSTAATSQTINVTTSGSYWVQVTNAGCSKRDTIQVIVNPAPVVHLGNDTTICSGNTITLNAGNPGAGYLWSTGASSQSINVTTAGNYWVQVTNASGCITRDTILISVNPTPTVALGNDTSFCAGANLTLNAQNPGATYLWNTTATGQTINVTTAGSYWVQVTNAGCSKRDTIQVTVNPAPVVHLGNDTTICADGSITLNAGNPGAAYLWSTGATTQQITANTAASYLVEVVSAAGCLNKDTIQVAVSPLPLVQLGNDTTICNGNSVTLDAANTGHTYLWNTGDTSQTITVQADGTYSVAVTNMFHCTGRDTIVLNVMPDPVHSGFNFIPLFNEAAGKVRFEPITQHSSYTYHWDFGDGQSSTLTTPEHTYTASGDYEVALTVTNDCNDTTAKLWIKVNLTSGVTSIYKNGINVALYPNPANELLTLALTNEYTFFNNIMIYTLTGQKILEQKAGKTRQEQINIHQLPSGIYILRVETNNGPASRKFEIIR